jgi:hypothetical protein
LWGSFFVGVIWLAYLIQFTDGPDDHREAKHWLIAFGFAVFPFLHWIYHRFKLLALLKMRWEAGKKRSKGKNVCLHCGLLSPPDATVCDCGEPLDPTGTDEFNAPPVAGGDVDSSAEHPLLNGPDVGSRFLYYVKYGDDSELFDGHTADEVRAAIAEDMAVRRDDEDDWTPIQEHPDFQVLFKDAGPTDD